MRATRPARVSLTFRRQKSGRQELCALPSVQLIQSRGQQCSPARPARSPCACAQQTGEQEALPVARLALLRGALVRPVELLREAPVGPGSVLAGTSPPGLCC